MTECCEQLNKVYAQVVKLESRMDTGEKNRKWFIGIAVSLFCVFVAVAVPPLSDYLERVEDKLDSVQTSVHAVDLKIERASTEQRSIRRDLTGHIERNDH
jgi:hypothetical protein